MKVVILSQINGLLHREEISFEALKKGGGIRLTERELKKLIDRLVWSVAKRIEGKTVTAKIHLDLAL